MAENTPRKKADVDAVVAESERKKIVLGELCARTKDLVGILLEDASIQFQSVQSRVKSVEKLKSKYCDPQKEYYSLDDITDQAGIRIITYYQDEVDKVADLIKAEFEIDSENSVDKREMEPDRFGYRALNLVCKHSKKRTAIVEYRKFEGAVLEIQVTSILSHAWSEMEHGWYDLKQDYPKEIKRKFSRLIALMELAEEEFLNIRKYRAELEKSIAVRVDANVFDLPVDAISIKLFMEKEPLVVEVDQLIAAALGVPYAVDGQPSNETIQRRATSAKLAGLDNLSDVRAELEKSRWLVPEFSEICSERLWSREPRDLPAFRGISIYHLALFLMSLKGKRALSEFFVNLKMSPYWDLEAQVAFAWLVVERRGQ
jgi:putative GTP pyrophosphokinase